VRRVVRGTPIAQAAAGDQAQLDRVPVLPRAHHGSVSFDQQRLGRRVQRLGRLPAPLHFRRCLGLGRHPRRADRRGVGAHRLDPKADPGAPLEPDRRGREGGPPALGGQPGWQPGAEHLLRCTLEHLVGGRPALLARRAGGVRPVQRSGATDGHRVARALLMGTATPATAGTGVGAALLERVV
jgi:hypothetical protein